MFEFKTQIVPPLKNIRTWYHTQNVNFLFHDVAPLTTFSGLQFPFQCLFSPPQTFCEVPNIHHWGVFRFPSASVELFLLLWSSNSPLTGDSTYPFSDIPLSSVSMTWKELTIRDGHTFLAMNEFPAYIFETCERLLYVLRNVNTAKLHIFPSQNKTNQISTSLATFCVCYAKFMFVSIVGMFEVVKVVQQNCEGLHKHNNSFERHFLFFSVFQSPMNPSSKSIQHHDFSKCERAHRL